MRTAGIPDVTAPPAGIVPDGEAPTGGASATPPSELPYATISAAGQLFVSNHTGMPAIDASVV